MRAHLLLLALAAGLSLSGPGGGRAAERGTSGMVRWTATAFSDLAGWADDRHDEALSAFARSCVRQFPASRGKVSEDLGPTNAIWNAVCQQALRPHILLDATAARRFLETNFTPYRIDLPGFLTGYYEPEIDGSLKKSGRFPVPLYRRPPDLGPKPYLTRAEIDSGALAGKGLELVHLADPIEAFFVHVQGSARIRLDDGQVVRVGFAAKNGHPYTAIGRVLIARGAIPAEEMTAQRLRQWLAEHPREAGAVMAENRSYIFFRRLDLPDPTLGPAGASGVQLTPDRSLAVDPSFHRFGTPVWIDADLPDANGRFERFRRLMIAQDAGSAITGAARGDIFFGSGAAAAARAGPVRHPGSFTILWPNGLALPDWAAGGG